MFRIHYEMKNQEWPGWFLSLTYNERYVPRVADGRLSLRFKDVQWFIKRLRRAGHYVKYVCVGEYGAETKRPHYHMLLWTSCPVHRLEEFWVTGYTHCSKKHKAKKLGAIHVGTLTMASAMYTLKYIIQPKQKAEKNGLEKTRAQFSQGLGLSYLSRAVYDYHTFDYESPNFMGIVDGCKVALPRYYRYKIFTKYQRAKEGSRVKWESIRKRRRKMREWIALGVVNASEYMQALRTEEARRIISKTKYNQTL